RAFEYARLHRERSHYLRTLEFELQWAGELQQKLLEVELPWRSAISMNVVYRPLPWLSCGGDYYDVIPFRDDSVIVLIGDVAGHGVKAAFVTAMLKSMIYRGFIRRSIETGFSFDGLHLAGVGHGAVVEASPLGITPLGEHLDLTLELPLP
ncbi:MAG: SpoIIE family protein phosphatase, partial [Nitriliruptoraceae bacterium]